MTERRVLIAIDGSEHSVRAFEWYCENIHYEDDVLILSNTLELPPKPPTPFPYADQHYEDWKKEIESARSKSKNMLAKFQLQCEERKIDTLNSVYDERYTPGPSICKIAKENNVQMIVLGSRGLSKMRRTFLGSVSDYVVHHSHLPVCVVPPYERVNSLREEEKQEGKQHTATASNAAPTTTSTTTTTDATSDATATAAATVAAATATAAATAAEPEKVPGDLNTAK